MAYTAIDDPSAYFKCQLYVGNGAANHAITFDDTDTDMQPDWVWIKNRDATDSHCYFDALRGATKVLHMDVTDAEATDADTLDSFTSDGFQVDADDKVNTNTEDYVSWNWKANGTGSANDVGSITTTATSANTTAGFSIVTNTGTGSAATIGHGLGKVPTVIITKKRSSTSAPMVYNVHNGNNYELYMDRTNGSSAAANTWASTTPTSTVWSVATDDNNASSATYISYVFTDIQGFSKFGEYVGNGNADGTFIFTGFKPAFVIIKKTSGTTDWYMYDNKRLGYNVDNNPIFPNSSQAAASSDDLDFLSNGFKLRSTNGELKDGTLIYMAWAEAPFVNSNGVPCNAR